jgi:hypothetical protein
MAAAQLAILASQVVAVEEISSVVVANATILQKATAVLISHNLAAKAMTVSRADVVQLVRYHVQVQQNVMTPRRKRAASKAARYGVVP